MKDRIPTKPNRYAVYDENHAFLRYEYHELADEPTEVGSRLDKANFLPDTVATALGLSGDPQIKDALAALNTLISNRPKIATGSYIGTGTYGSGYPQSLTFAFVPTCVFIMGPLRDANNGSTKGFVAFFHGVATYAGVSPVNYTSGTVSWSGNSVSWYSSDISGGSYPTYTQFAQLNGNSSNYYYIAIGY